MKTLFCHSWTVRIKIQFYFHNFVWDLQHIIFTISAAMDVVKCHSTLAHANSTAVGLGLKAVGIEQVAFALLVISKIGAFFTSLGLLYTGTMPTLICLDNRLCVTFHLVPEDLVRLQYTRIGMDAWGN